MVVSWYSTLWEAELAPLPSSSELEWDWLSVPLLPVLAGPCQELNFHPGQRQQTGGGRMKRHLLANHLLCQGSICGARWGPGGWASSPSQRPNKVVQGGTGQHATFSPPLVSVHPKLPEPLPPPRAGQVEWVECKLVPQSPLWCQQSLVESWIPIPLESAKWIHNLENTKMR